MILMQGDTDTIRCLEARSQHFVSKKAHGR